MLLNDAAPTDPELAALRRPDEAEQQLLQARAAQLLVSPISSGVGRVVEQTFGVDTFQITPSLTDPTAQSSRLIPGARLTIGKRISNRVLPDVLAVAVGLVDHPRPGHPARVRPERPAVVGAVAERRPHVRARRAREVRLLMRHPWSVAEPRTAWPRLAFARRPPRSPADAALGQPVVSQSVAIDGRPATDPALLELVQTRVGHAADGGRRPREHRALHGPGAVRRRRGAVAADAGGVVLSYDLVPARAVGRIVFHGKSPSSERLLRDRIEERFGAAFPLTPPRRSGAVSRKRLPRPGVPAGR